MFVSPSHCISRGETWGCQEGERDPRPSLALPVLGRWTQAKAWGLQVLSRQNPTRQAQLRRFPGSPLSFSPYCLRLSTLVGWWFSMVLCSVSLLLVSALDFRFLVTTRFTQNIP